jgi:hypothetical protein
MCWRTAVEIYIFLVLTPEEGLTPSPYGVLSRVHPLIMRNSFVTGALSFCTEQFCHEGTLYILRNRVRSLLITEQFVTYCIHAVFIINRNVTGTLYLIIEQSFHGANTLQNCHWQSRLSSLKGAQA